MFRVRLKLEFATTETEVHQADIGAGELPTVPGAAGQHHQQGDRPRQAAKPLRRAVPGRCEDYVATRCFGKRSTWTSEAIRSHLSRLEMQEGIAKYLARKIAELTIERRAIEFDKADFRLSETKPFSWRRNLPPL